MSHPIICFEGPSGVGKTTLCRLISTQYNIVPEVNLLFQRKEKEPKFWYYDRQIDRYQVCKNADRTSILDGDIFQPIWYNWVCNYPAQFVSKIETHQFYETKLHKGEIAFPNLYIIFNADVETLRFRKEADKSRQRRNFEKHLKIIEPLRAYYKFLDQETDLEMKFVEYADLESTKNEVLSILDGFEEKAIDQLETFEQIKNWINQKS